MKLSIIVPIYNEEDNIEPLYNKISNSLAETYQYELIFINDGSTDNTKETLSDISRKDKKIKIINFKRNFGQTAAMMAGIDMATGDVIIPIDGDLQNDPEDIPKLLKKLEEGYDVCSGWRKNRKDNKLIRNFPSRMANILISYVSGVQLHDYGCSLKAYKKEVIKGVKLYGEMHRFIPIYASWQGAKVTEIPVEHHPRIHGTSKYGIKRTFKVILDLMVVKFMAKYGNKPIYLFGGFGLINFIFSFLTFLLMIYFKYWGGKSFIQTPLPTLLVFFSLIGFQSIFMGFIAEMLMRTYHESQNKPVYLIDECINIDWKGSSPICRGCYKKCKEN